MDFEITHDMVVVENDDPRVTYSHGWRRVPAEPNLCSGDSFHRSYCKGASARFEFEGSHIWVVGHRSASHGNIKINIDGQPGIATINAWGGARELVPFRNLFEHEFTEAGPHWIEVINDLSGSEITIDSFAYRPMSPGRTWKIPAGSKLVTIADTDPRTGRLLWAGRSVGYSGKWTQYIADGHGRRLGIGSCHVTYSINATATVSFETAHFWVIGDMYPDRGRYSVSVDGGLFETFSGYEPSWRGYVIKYERQFASPGPHQIVLRNDEDKGFCFDAIIYEAPMSSDASTAPGARSVLSTHATDVAILSDRDSSYDTLTSSVGEQTEPAM